MEVPTTVTNANPTVRISVKIIKTDRALGIFSFLSPFNSGEQSMAMNNDSMNGTMMDPAARIPATTITKAAAVTRKRAPCVILR